MSFELISEVTASSAQSTLSFTNIPQTYKTLKVFISARGEYTGTRNNIAIAFNSDSSNSNYKGYEWYYEDGALGGEFNNNGSTAPRYLGAMPGLSGDTNQFGAVEIIIPNYANSTNYKVLYTSIAAPKNSSTGYSYWDRGTTWLSNSAITSITFTNPSGTGSNFSAASTIWLYGLK
jgi:hypothetical protein